MGDVQLGPVTHFTPRDVENLWIANGGDPAKARTAAAIVFSTEDPSGNAGIVNDTPSTGDYSVGLWEINYSGSLGPARTAQFGSAQALADDPNLQAKAAISMSANGTNWGAWGPDFGYSGYSSTVAEPLPGSRVANWLAGNPQSTPAPGVYRNPFRDVKGLAPERVDQGVDYSGNGPVYAIGPATIVVLNPNAPGGWNGAYVSYRLESGPAAGKLVYFAETMTLNSALTVGASVDANTVLGTMSGGIETGWCAANGMQPLSQLWGVPTYQDGTSTALGIDFNSLLIALGAPSGIISANKVGSLPPGWPVDWHIEMAPAIVGMAPTASGKGYWLAASDGGVYPFGDAKGHGSAVGRLHGAAVVGIAATPSGNGYWLVGADGSVYPFGDAKGRGSMTGHRLDAPVVGIAASPSGDGYWLVGGDGGLFNFGDARFLGSLAGKPHAPIVAFAVKAPSN